MQSPISRFFLMFFVCHVFMMVTLSPLSSGEHRKKKRLVEFISANLVKGKLLISCYTDSKDWKAIHDVLKKEARHRLKEKSKILVKIYQFWCFDDKALTPDFQVTDGIIPEQSQPHLVVRYDNDPTGEPRFCFGGMQTEESLKGNFQKCIDDADEVTSTTYDLNP